MLSIDIVAVSSATTLPLFVLRLPLDAVTDAAFLATHRVRIRYIEQAPYAMAVKAIHDGLQHLKDGGDIADLQSRQAAPALLRNLDRTEEFKQWQASFLKQ